MDTSNNLELPEWLKWVFWVGVFAAIAVGTFEYQRVRTRTDDRAIKTLNEELQRGRGGSSSTSHHEQIKHARIIPRGRFDPAPSR